MPFLMPPFLVLLLGALATQLFSNARVRGWLGLAFALLSLANLLQLPHGAHFQLQYLGLELTLARVDGLSFVFGLAFHLVAIVAALYSWHNDSRTERAFGMLYAAAGLGVVFAGDLLALFLAWESLTLCAMVIIWSAGTPAARAAGYRYALFHILGGLLLLAGVILRIQATGDASFGHIGLDSPGGWLIFLGFGVNAAWPLLHPWLPDAYPEASPTGTIYLSAFTTKGAVYVLARSFAGTEALIWIGVVMTIFPIFYAVIENNLRRVLSYSLVNQVGFMMAAIGIGSELAINGACAHAFVHLLYKALLFMSMGAVLHRTGTTLCTELGGLHKSMPWTCLFCLIGSASISAFPLFSGFVAKSLILSSAAEAGLGVAWLALLLASTGVLDHSGIKVPFFAFFSHDAGLRPKEAPWNMLAAMALAACACVLLGCAPSLLYGLLPHAMTYEPYTASHVISQLQLLGFAALAFGFLVKSGMYPAEIRAVNLDADFLYRRALAGLAWAVAVVANGLNAWSASLFFGGLFPWLARVHGQFPWRLGRLLARPFLWLLPREQRGVALAEIRPALEHAASPIGLTALACVVFFCLMVLVMGNP